MKYMIWNTKLEERWKDWINQAGSLNVLLGI